MPTWNRPWPKILTYFQTFSISTETKVYSQVLSDDYEENFGIVKPQKGIYFFIYLTCKEFNFKSKAVKLNYTENFFVLVAKLSSAEKSEDPLFHLILIHNSGDNLDL